MTISMPAPRALTLAQLPLHTPATVQGVAAPAGAPDWPLRLAEIGFIAGEPVRLLAQARPGGDPLVVRIGDSTFALRRAEATCVLVERVQVQRAEPAR